jgi:hypothetical protein
MTEKERLLSGAAKLADIALSGAGLGSLLLLFYVLYYYGWTGQRQFSNLAGWALYYGLPATLAVLLFSCLRLKKDHKINIALFILSLAGSLYAAQLVLQVSSPALAPQRPIWVFDGESRSEKQKKAARIEKEFGVRFDTRDRIEVIADLNKRGVDAVPAIIPRMILSTPNDPIEGRAKSVIKIRGEETLPLGGVANVTTVVCNETGQWITYKSDEHGFNNPEGGWRSGQIDIASVGDSFTQGYCLPREESFMGIVRREYPATLNLGMAADGPLYMLATIDEYLSTLKPRIVLWGYFEEDALRDLEIEKKSPLLMRYLIAGFSQKLVHRQSAVDQVLRSYLKKAIKDKVERAETPKDSQWTAKLLTFAKMGTLRKSLGMSVGETSEEKASLEFVRGPDLNLFREILLKAKDRVHRWGGKLYFVYLPGWKRYAGGSDIGTQQRVHVLNLAKSLEIPIIDVHRAFAAQDVPLALFPFHGAGHYVAEGHELVGQEILKAISTSLSGAPASAAPVTPAGQDGIAP